MCKYGDLGNVTVNNGDWKVKRTKLRSTQTLIDNIKIIQF